MANNSQLDRQLWIFKYLRDIVIAFKRYYIIDLLLYETQIQFEFASKILHFLTSQFQPFTWHVNSHIHNMYTHVFKSLKNHADRFTRFHEVFLQKQCLVLAHKVATFVCVLMAKLAVTASYGAVYVYTAEQFPTVVRNMGLGVGSFFARIGGIVAPLINSMVRLVYDVRRGRFAGFIRRHYRHPEITQYNVSRWIKWFDILFPGRFGDG